MLYHVRIGTPILFDVIGIELDWPDGAVAGIRGIAVGVGERVSGVERQTAPPAAKQLQLARVELAAAGIRHDVHVVAVEGERQPRIVRRDPPGRRDRAGLQGVVVAIDQQLAHRRTDVADAQTQLARQLTLERQVVLIDVGTLEVRIDPLVTEPREVPGDAAPPEKPLRSPPPRDVLMKRNSLVASRSRMP